MTDNMPGDANTNYISLATQVPLWELLRRIPKGLQLGMEMKDADGTVYGHSHTPIGLHCHQAADELMVCHAQKLDPDMPLDQLLLYMGELTQNEILVARSAIRWANNQANRYTSPLPLVCAPPAP